MAKRSRRAEPTVVAIVGPTASGKTRLAVQLAKKFDGEIVSADSRQVYRGLDIGSGKDRAEYGRVPVHLLDVASPRQVFTVAQYQRLACAAIRSILLRGKLPILVGGSGLYVDAITRGLTLPHSKPDWNLRKKMAARSLPQLLAWLKRLDLAAWQTVDRQNRRRVERAVETLVHTKQPLAKSRQLTPPPYQVLTIGLNVPRAELRRRIAKRLRARLRQGLVAEVRRLKHQGLSDHRLRSLGLEYAWVSRFLSGQLTRAQLELGLSHAIAQFAKRQMTWFKRDEQVAWVNTSARAIITVRQALRGRAQS